MDRDVAALRARIPGWRAWARGVDDRGGWIALGIALLYVWLAPPHIVDGDNAEFVAIGELGGGVAHPSGYPLYVLWLRAMSWLPAQTPAHAAALATVFLAVAQVLALHAACRAWGASPRSASFVVAIYAVAPTALRMHTQAEVFALNGLMVALVIWVAAPHGPLVGRWRTILLALLAGLGLSNHLTCVLVAPVGLYGAVVGLREQARGRVATVLVAVIALAVGLAPYLYLLIARGGPVTWLPLDGFAGLVRHFMRADYGELGSFAADGAAVSVLDNEAALLAAVARSWLWLPAVVAVAALADRCIRGPDRAAWCAFALSVCLAGPLLVTLFNVELDGFGRYINSRFYLLPSMLLAVPAAIGIDVIARRFGTRLSANAAGTIAHIGPLVMLALGTAASLPGLAHAHSPAMERQVRRVLEAAPPDAVVVAMSDDFTFGAPYLQHALGIRPDVTVVRWPFIASPWYAARIQPALGFDATRGTRGEHLSEARDVTRLFIDRVHLRGRPLLVMAQMVRLLRPYARYPLGVMYRILPATAPKPSTADVVRENLAWFAGLDLDYPAPLEEGDWDTLVHRRYVEAWTELARSLGSLGDDAQAREAAAMAATLAPR
ncbi:MAG: DUF2723 domain-containing protein [Kofleriaceae bacterium]